MNNFKTRSLKKKELYITMADCVFSSAECKQRAHCCGRCRTI